jgi:cholesterol oxidase
MWPNKGESDKRTEQGQAYRRIPPTAPNNPVVPEGAPGALRLPLVEISPARQEGARSS